MLADSLRRLCLQVGVVVPAAGHHLDEPHAALDQPAGDEQLGAQVGRCRTRSRTSRRFLV